MKYNPAKIEKKCAARWEKSGVFKASNTSNRPKWYSLIEFPYPSGSGLHVGHIRSNTAMDIISRKRRMEGYSVLYPIGWDAFGLPTENYAIKTGVAPQIATKKNTDTFRKQLKSLGFSFDWSREVNTTDPSYYRWTQWLFLKFFEKGLAYKAKVPINWCPNDKIGLANEEVVNGKCERCGTAVEERLKEQWMLKITAYADKLLDGLNDVDFLPEIKQQQENWIGRSEGAEIAFPIIGSKNSIRVFTTRPDTLFGATYLVIAPDNPYLLKALEDPSALLKNKDEVRAYSAAAKKNAANNQAQGKTGVELKGLRVINPATKEEIPVWVSDYVLSSYGTGAIMAVPAHDERDYAFAKQFGLPIREVVVPNIIDKRNPPVAGKKFVERKNIHAIVRDPKTGKYLALKWKKFDWTTFPMGGMEEGESPETAARREVEEETGFTNLKLVQVLPGTVRAEYFATHKDENRVAYTRAVVFELIDRTQREIAAKEKEDHEIIWLDAKELNYEYMTHAEVGMWQEMLRGDYCFSGEGVLINSGEFSGQPSEKAKAGITQFVGGKTTVKYKLRDWVFSRQRYWGEPIPLVFCEKDSWVPVPEKDLPVKLPPVKKYEPTDTGESPLSKIEKWVKTKCPRCKGPARRETDTMPNWAGSSWYYLAYLFNKKGLAKPTSIENWKLQIENFRHWMPVDWYNGGMEHVTLHLLYSRFWNLFLYDEGLVPVKEPYKKRTAHGTILAADGKKMSKSLGNVVNPDELVKEFGADALRLYEMFIGPFDQAVTWDPRGILGTSRFLEKVWKIGVAVSDIPRHSERSEESVVRLLHKTIKKVGEDIEAMSFNTAVSAMMIFVNEVMSDRPSHSRHSERSEESVGISKNNLELFLRILSPFAPFITEELWALLGNKKSIQLEPWPDYDPALLAEETFMMPVQINGKVRGAVNVARGLSEDEAKAAAFADPAIKKWIISEPKKVIFVKDRLINFVL